MRALVNGGLVHEGMPEIPLVSTPTHTEVFDFPIVVRLEWSTSQSLITPDPPPHFAAT